MDHLWSPWRYKYVSKASPNDPCIFCAKSSDDRDAENFLVCRGQKNFVLLNTFPYTTGHLMIAPYEHRATLAETPADILSELMTLTQTAEACLRAVYSPQGFNIGMNVGECAGAGVAGHIHMHILPRWYADSNFMTTVAETRVLPETLEATYTKVLEAFREMARLPGLPL